MPPRVIGSIRRLSGVDLPVLPFLAPRLAGQLYVDPQRSYSHFVTPRCKSVPQESSVENPSLLSKSTERCYSHLRENRHPLAASSQKRSAAVSSIARSVEENPHESHSSNQGPFGSVKEERMLSSSDSRRRHFARLPRFDTRAKYVSLKPTYTSSDFGNPPILEPLSTDWTRAFSAINAEYDHANTVSISRRPIKFHRNKEHWVEDLLASGLDINSIAAAWKRLSDSSRRQRWFYIMLWALQHSPEYAFVVLEATHTAPFPPGYAVADSLDHITSYFLRDGQKVDEEKVDDIIRVTCLILDRGPLCAPDIHQTTIYRLLQHCTEKQAVTLFDALYMANVPLHENTLLHLADFFARTAHFERATRALQLLAQQEADLSSDKVLSVSVTLLRNSAEQGNGYSLSSRILAELLEIGLRPNLVVYNVIMLNAFEAGDSATGWRVYDLLLKNGVKPDEFTYSILMKEAKSSANIEVIDRIATSARSDGVLFNSPYVITELLGAIYAFQKRRKRRHGHAFKALLSAFKTFFDVRPLVELGLASPDHYESTTNFESTDMAATQKGSDFALMQASPQALTIMLTAFLERCPNHKLISQLFCRYRDLLDQGHPQISQLAETDHTANIFLKGLSRFPETLHFCPMVIEQMLRLATESSELTGSLQDGPSATSIRKAEPTVQTWSILLYAFHRHGQSAAAEKVLRMMHKRGVSPNQVTWNSLVSGYAQMQDVDGVVGAMKRMEQAGWEVDSYTLEGLGKVVDRKSLMDAFEHAEHSTSNGDGETEASGDIGASESTELSDMNRESRIKEKDEDPGIDVALKNLIQDGKATGSAREAMDNLASTRDETSFIAERLSQRLASA